VLAIAVVSELKYEEAAKVSNISAVISAVRTQCIVINFSVNLKILDWQWEELDHNDALSLAACAECKDFFATPHVQRNLDDVSSLPILLPFHFFLFTAQSINGLTKTRNSTQDLNKMSRLCPAQRFGAFSV
jgi:hypothetical protein